jgi:hypothetical protein
VNWTIMIHPRWALAVTILVLLITCQKVTGDPPDEARGNAPRVKTRATDGPQPYEPTARYAVRRIEG